MILIEFQSYLEKLANDSIPVYNKYHPLQRPANEKDP